MAKRLKTQEEIPGWVLWVVEHGFVAVMAIIGSALLLIAGVAYWLDNRLDRLEGEISRKPPQSYAPPNLDAFQAPEVDDQIVQKHSVYVPVYSHVYFGGGRPSLLEATLSIRNTSSVSPVYVQSVRYYNTEGELVKEPVKQLIMLKPMQTLEFVIPQRDSSGGSGANFLVEWLETGDGAIALVEAVMVGNAGPQGISFKSEGVEVGELDKLDPVDQSEE